MNKLNAKDFLPLVQALADGKTIQLKLHDGTWQDLEDVCFDKPLYCYRIKPRPVEYDVWRNKETGEMYPVLDGHSSRQGTRWERITIREIVAAENLEAKPFDWDYFWKKAPKWANYIMMDQYNNYFYFDREPKFETALNMFTADEDCRFEIVSTVDSPPPAKNWRGSTQKRPNK